RWQCPAQYRFQQRAQRRGELDGDGASQVGALRHGATDVAGAEPAQRVGQRVLGAWSVADVDPVRVWLIDTICVTRSGSGCVRCCRWIRVGVAGGLIIVRRSTGCCGALGRGVRGGTCPASTAAGRPSTSGTIVGRRAGPGRGFWVAFARAVMRPKAATGPWG